MKKNAKKIFGEIVKGYKIPVLNEREIRASAGILFLLLYTALMIILFKENFFMIKILITIFLIDFAIRIFINPKYSPTIIIGRLIVRNQTPEYVGAAQKKFAWIIGLILASIMFILMVLVNSYSIITGLICLTCLIFLFFESVFGICLGCIFYGWIYKEKAQHCPGEICEVKARHEIQKITKTQITTLIILIIVFVIVGVLFYSYLNQKPEELFSMIKRLMNK